VKEGQSCPARPLHSKAATRFRTPRRIDKYEADRVIAQVSAFALAASKRTPAATWITAPTGGSAGVMPAIVTALMESKRGVTKEKMREGLLAGLAVGYPCKHNATPAAAEGGCQSEIGVASAMVAALIAQVLTRLRRFSRTRRNRRWSTISG
jgi:L-serine dehydratase